MHFCDFTDHTIGISSHAVTGARNIFAILYKLLNCGNCQYIISVGTQEY